MQRKLTTVYRIEKDIDGQVYGAFTAPSVKPELTHVCNEYKDSLVRIPAEPIEDGCSEFTSGMLTGVRSLLHFDAWFLPMYAVNNLIESGFQISVYIVESEHLIEGENQVVWNPENSRRIGSISPEQLYVKLEEELDLQVVNF